MKFVATALCCFFSLAGAAHAAADADAEPTFSIQPYPPGPAQDRVVNEPGQQAGAEAAGSSEAEAADGAEVDPDDDTQFNAMLASKLATANRAAALAADPSVKRVPLADFLMLLQRETCRLAFGELEHGFGAACMADAVISDADDVDDQDDAAKDDMRVCAEHGGVLVSRMPACTDASMAMATLFHQQGEGAALEDLMFKYTDVARYCWGRTLCVE